MLHWSDEMNDPASAAGRAATAAAPAFAAACRACWPDQCKWMECWGELHSLESWRACAPALEGSRTLSNP